MIVHFYEHWKGVNVWNENPKNDQNMEKLCFLLDLNLSN